jgi:hypothetical protein
LVVLVILFAPENTLEAYHAQKSEADRTQGCDRCKQDPAEPKSDQGRENCRSISFSPGSSEEEEQVTGWFTDLLILIHSRKISIESLRLAKGRSGLPGLQLV